MATKKEVSELLAKHVPEADLTAIAEDLFENFRLLSRRNPRIKFAEKVEIEQTESWVEVNFMVRVLGIQRWMISDESALSDFWPSFDIENADGIGQEPGTYVFTQNWIDDEGTEIKDTEERKPSRFREETILKSLEVFGVNPPRWVWRLALPGIFSHIQKEITDAKRQECEAWAENDAKT